MSDTGFLDDLRGTGPLRHLTVLDFSQMMMGPVATQLLGDLGALVIKVERPVKGEWERDYLPRGRRLDGESPYFLAMNRNKLGVTADLRDPQDLAFVRALASRCDVVVENFRPGVMERLGLGYDDLRAENPSLVYASGSGYGPQGPEVGRPGQDLLVQGASGLAANSGPAGRPPVPVAAPVLDASTAFLMAFAVVSAAWDAQRTGTPRKIDVSLLATSLMVQCQEAFVALNTDLEWERSESGVAAPWADAPYGIYATRDGYVAVAMTPRERLAEHLDLPRRLAELDDADYFAARDEVDQHVRSVLARESLESALARLDGGGVWCAAVRSLPEVLEDPQVAANGYLSTVRTNGGEQVRAVGLPMGMSEAGDVDRLPPPRVGEHDERVRRAVESHAPRDA